MMARWGGGGWLGRRVGRLFAHAGLVASPASLELSSVFSSCTWKMRHCSLRPFRYMWKVLGAPGDCGPVG